MGHNLIGAEKLVGVHPDLVRVIERAARECPIPLRVLDGVRTIEDQKRHVASGASQTMKSKHLPQADGYGHAVDIAPYFDLDGDGEVSSPELFSWQLYHRIAPYIKAAAKAEGVRLVWGGDWKSFKDGPHWELADPWSFATLLGGAGPYQEETAFNSRGMQTAGAGLGGAGLIAVLASMNPLTVAVLAAALIVAALVFVGPARIQKFIDGRMQ